MAIVWTIAGEAGKAVDATERTLPELQAEGATVEFRSADSDRLTWTVWINNISGSSAIIPDIGQKITLFRNGARYFTGNVTNPRKRVSAGRIEVLVTVEGPWWWLKRMMISNELADQAGTVSERTAFVFDTGSVTSHLQGLITRAIALGAPISAGSIATCFDIPRLSVRNVSFAECFTELMRWVADGILYFDYTQDDEAFPALCMQRRGAASTVTITPSAGVVPSIDVEPRLDLQVSDIKVTSAERATVDNKRVTIWASSTAGTANPDLPQRQLLVVSGPEMDTYLPQDFTDSVVVRSQAISSAEALILRKEDRLRAGGVASDFTVGGYSDSVYTLPEIFDISDVDGNNLPSGYDYYLIEGEPADWWAKDGIGYVNARLTATIYTLVDEELPLPANPYVTPIPDWYQIIGGAVANWIEPDPATAKWLYSTTVSVPFVAVNTSWPTATTLIRQEDYGFVNPPAGLAADLLATQNWLPYQGSVSTVIDPDSIPLTHLVGAKMNIEEVTGDLETMGALISGQTVTLRTGQISYSLGAPARLAYRDIVSRFRQSGADNVVWINETNPLGGEGPSGLRLTTEGGDDLLTEDGSAIRKEG